MKGLNSKFYKHQINLATDAKPVKRATWLSPIVIVPKKNRKIKVCVDYRKLNTITITNAFPLPFMEIVLYVVAGHER